MTDAIHEAGAITLVGGAPLPPGVLAEALAYAPAAYAADGGAEALLAAGIVPDRVIGDLDSLPAGTRAALGDRVIHVADQDTTDLEKCLSLIDAPLTLGVGFVGARLDHTLAALGAISAARRPVLLLGSDDVAFALTGDLAIDLAPGTRVSLMPLVPVRVGSTGLRWGTDLILSPTGRTGGSNMALGPVTLAPAGPGALLVTERAALGRLLSATGPGAPSRFLNGSLP